MARLLEKTRYLALLGIISLLLASVAAYGWGAVKTINTITLIFTSYGKDSYIAVSLIELVDSFLIAIALQIFALSMYELFVGDINLPDWMLAHNLHELKTKLSSVIILVMVVKFLEHLVEWKNPNDSLFFAIAVSVVAATLIALSYFGEKTEMTPPPNKACTGRWGLCRNLKQFPTPYHFQIGRRSAVRPSASNANRWALKCKI
jgi:uncharacterized membrane protein YqhA